MSLAVFELLVFSAMSVVLILGSGPNVVACRDWPRAPFDQIVAINNAWSVRPDWDFLIHPEDFPPNRRPVSILPHQRVVTADDYVPMQNSLGGFVFAGGTMAFTAAYWALAALRPRVIAMLGCDMVYPKSNQTHFYGKGEADPLRDDVTLRDLTAKSARLMIKAARKDCAMVNLSQDESRLIFPRATQDDLNRATPVAYDQTLAADADAREDALGYMVPSGRYWEVKDTFDIDAIDTIDALWLKAARPD